MSRLEELRQPRRSLETKRLHMLFLTRKKVETDLTTAKTYIAKHIKKGRRVFVATEVPDDYKGLGASITTNLLEFADEAEKPETVLVIDFEIPNAEDYIQRRKLTNPEPQFEALLIRGHIDRCKVWNDTLQGFWKEANSDHKRKREDFEQFNNWARVEVNCRFNELRKKLEEREEDLIIVRR